MINSYEFDQPLDLRLKALNLSLSPFNQHHSNDTLYSPISHLNGSLPSSSHQTSLASSESINNGNFSKSNCSINTVGGAFPNLNQPRTNPSHPPMATKAPTTAHQQPSSPCIQRTFSHNQQQRYLTPDLRSTSLQSAQLTEANKNTHIRSTNIHCQPLNHHQPHPLASRLNPMASSPVATSLLNTSSTPITRQSSLVARYNCKPCGIGFSQPETLRAHQEGYCTKRDRSQTQVRSQSAVSQI